MWIEGNYYSMKHNGKQRRAHRVLWESINGPVPPGFDLHHIDGNPLNNKIENIMLITKSDHQRHHAGWIRDELGAWVGRPCTRCKVVKLFSEFYPSTGKHNSRCKECDKERAREASRLKALLKIKGIE